MRAVLDWTVDGREGLRPGCGPRMAVRNGGSTLQTLQLYTLSTFAANAMLLDVQLP